MTLATQIGDAAAASGEGVLIQAQIVGEILREDSVCPSKHKYLLDLGLQIAVNRINAM
jgi:hypothetical protein